MNKTGSKSLWAIAIVLVAVVIILALSGTFTGQATWENEIGVVNDYLREFGMKPIDREMPVLRAMDSSINFENRVDYDYKDWDGIIQCLKDDKVIDSRTKIIDLAKDEVLFKNFQESMNNCAA